MLMTSYFNVGDVTAANLTTEIFYRLLTITCSPHFEKVSVTHGTGSLDDIKTGYVLDP